jgi:hypothetical protein
MHRKLTSIIVASIAVVNLTAGIASAGANTGTSSASADASSGLVGLEVSVPGFSDAELRAESRCVEYGPEFHLNRRALNAFTSGTIPLFHTGDRSSPYTEIEPLDGIEFIPPTARIPTQQQWRTWCEGLQGEPPTLVEAPGSARFPWIDIVSVDRKSVV